MQRNDQPKWQGQTEAQREAVLRISKPEGDHRSGLVRSRGDGTDELLVWRSGFIRRYLITPDGTAELVEEIPPPPSYKWQQRIFASALAVFLVGALSSLVVQWAMVIGLVALLFGIFVGNMSELSLRIPTRPGERWQQLHDLSG